MCGPSRELGLPAVSTTTVDQQTQQLRQQLPVAGMQEDLELVQQRLRLRLKARHVGQPDAVSTPQKLSPRSAASTPGKASDSLAQPKPRCLPGRYPSCSTRQRFSTDLPLLGQPQQHQPANPWASNSSYGPSSSIAHTSGGSSSSSTCSIVRAIAGLGLDGAPSRCASVAAASGAAGSAFAAAAAIAAAEESLGRRGFRGSISTAKRILDEAVNSVPGAHGLASCASSAADTGVLAPLLSIIRNNGITKASDSSSSSSRGSVSRRSSFSSDPRSEGSFAAPNGSSPRSHNSSSSRNRVRRNSSFSEASGGLDSTELGADKDEQEASHLKKSPSRCCSGSVSSSCRTSGSISRASSSSLSSCCCPSPPPSMQQEQLQQQKVADCIGTVRCLAMDDANRMALIDLGAIDLLLSKLAPPKSSSSSAGSSNAVTVAALSALSVLARHDAAKLRVWDNPQSAALLQLLSLRHTSPVVKAAHLCVANLAWSVDYSDRALPANSSGSSVFDSVSSSHHSRDDAASTSSSCCGSNVLLTPALLPALAAGLHPSADAPVLLSLLKLLTKAGSSRCLAPSPATSPCSSSASEGSSEQLCVAPLPPLQRAAWRVGWQQAVFALQPLLAPAQHTSSSSIGGGSNGSSPSICSTPHQQQQQQVLAAAMELVLTLAEQHMEFHAVMCAAGCLEPLLLTLLASGTSSELSLQAACVLNVLLDCPEAQRQLGQEQALALLLQVLGNRQASVDVLLVVLIMLRRLASSSHSVGQLLKLQGAVPTVVSLLQQVHSSEVKRSAITLLQLLGKQVVVRHRKSSTTPAQAGSACDASSRRSSLESTCSAVVAREQLLCC